MTRQRRDKVPRPFDPWRALGASLVLVPVVLIVTFIPSSAQRTGAAAPQPVTPREFVNQYCAGCHNARLKTGNLILDKLDPENVAPDAGTWEKVVGKLRAGMMPPAGA